MKLTKKELQDLHDDLLRMATAGMPLTENRSVFKMRCQHLQDHINALDDDSSNPPGNPPPPPPGPGHG